MKLFYKAVIYLMNLRYFSDIYKLGELDNRYFIYKIDNYKNIASVSVHRFFMIHLPIFRLSDALLHTYSEDERRYVLYHELGHFKLKHHFRYISIFDKDSLRELEYEADEYAMNKVGKEVTLKGMKKTRNILMELGCKLDEIDDRIVVLELKDESICG